MSPAELNAWILFVGLLMNTAAKTIDDIKVIFAREGLSKEDQDAILRDLIDENRRRRAISAVIAGLSVPSPVPVPTPLPGPDGDPGL